MTHSAIILLSCSLLILGSSDLWSEERIDALNSELAHALGEGYGVHGGFGLRWAGEDFVIVKMDEVTDLDKIDNIEDLTGLTSKSSAKTNLVIFRFGRKELAQNEVEAIAAANRRGIKIEVTASDRGTTIRIGQAREFLDKVS